MRFPSQARHFVISSIPLALVLTVIFAVWGSESNILWTFRVHKANHDLVRQLMFWVTDYTNYAMYAVYLGMLIWGARYKRPGVIRMAVGFAVVQILVCLGIVNLVKVALGRPRPMTESLFYEFISLDHFYHSLPSGHTAEIYGAVTPLILALRRWWVTILFGLLAALVGFSRIYLYQHYPTDVIFGWLFGAYAGWATYAYWDHVKKNRVQTT